MRPFPSILLILLIVAGANAQTVADLRVLSETPNSIVIEFTPRYANTVVTGTDGVKYTRFEFHGAAFAPGEPGSPLVPFRPVLLQFPSRRYSVEVLAQDYDDLPGIKAATRPSLQAIKGFGLSPAYSSPKPKYLVSERVPRQSVEVKDVGVSRGVLLGTLRIYPVQFSFSRNEVRVFRRIVVRVDFTGGRSTSQGASAFLKNQFPSQLLKTDETGLQNLASDSPLAQGDWYRMEVTETGMYRIDQAFLTKAGISSSLIGSINSIRIFGNDGQELPEDLNAARPNGNEEIPRLVVDKNGNGLLDADDFILFYGKSTRGWKYAPAEKTFSHYINHYTETNVYFLTYGGTGRGKNMDSLSSTSFAGGYKPTDTQGKVFVEDEKFNLVNSGREWVGEDFDISKTFYSFTNNLPGFVSTKPMTYRFAFLSRSASVDTFNVQENSQLLGVPILTYPIELASIEQEMAYRAPVYEFNRTGALPNDRSLVRIQFGTGSQAAQGWLDWFEILFKRRLEADNDLLLFSSPDTSALINYEVSQFSSRDINVFDVTQHNGAKQVTNLAFDAADASVVRFQLSQTNGSVRELIAMGPKGYKTAVNVRRISNSNLHGNTAGADFVILSPSDFAGEAQRLKTHREQYDQMTVSVVNLDQLFNEFSSGAPDPVAIRDFLKYAQTTWKVKPHYVLLFGAGNYDYKNIKTTATNWVPPYETLESNIQILTLASDDYYVFLDPSAEKISMAIGRLPIRSLTDAQTVVNKIISYETSAPFDSWRNRITLVADDGLTSIGDDGTIHTSQAEDLAQFHTPDSFTKEKIFIVQYPTVNTSTGRRKPTANEAIDEAINQGTAILNWTGHGNTQQWAHEKIFSVDQDFPLLNNKGKLFFLVAATCDFARYDYPTNASDASAGEQLLLMADRGAVAEVTADRVVYSSENALLNEALYDNLLKMDAQGKPVRLGDAMWQTKQTLNSTNDKKHHLLGDPTMRLAVPRGVVSIDSVNGRTAASLVTAGALSKVRVAASVKKSDGSTSASLRGQALLEVYDSKRRVLVPEWGDYSFVVNGSLIYRGQISVRNGQVQGTFPIPKDVSYGTDRSRIALYASNDSTDAVGFTENFSITGTSVAALDTTGPSINIYFDNQSSHTGGVIAPDATMIVDLADSSGINTSTAGIGHKLEATLDASQKTFDLTGFYSGNLDTYQSGQIRYPFTTLPEGRHTISVKAWDIYNNSSSAEAFFEVRAESQLALYNVFNVPNPFARTTTFTFQRTSNDLIDIEIKVYTVAGRLIQTLEASSVVDRFVQIPWDGRDRDGSELANGVYLYRVIAKSLDRTSTSEVIGKLAVLR